MADKYKCGGYHKTKKCAKENGACTFTEEELKSIKDIRNGGCTELIAKIKKGMRKNGR